MLRTISLTQEQIDALGCILQYAFEDQSNYFSDGFMESDYDQEGLTEKSKMLEEVSTVANVLGLKPLAEAYCTLSEEILEAATKLMGRSRP